MKLRDLVPERLFTWYIFRKCSTLCLSYGGTVLDNRVRVCDKRRGHFDSHTYEYFDVIQARYPQ